jgi:hypothetical protein
MDMLSCFFNNKIPFSVHKYDLYFYFYFLPRVVEGGNKQLPPAPPEKSEATYMIIPIYYIS